MQGDTAYESIIDGIMTLDSMGLDVMIVGRGGGSVEDLYTFNDERVAYAIFNAKTPIISAVGHEINDSISDLVADLRVATPTAAGEAATFDYYEFENDIENYKMTLDNLIDRKIDAVKNGVKVRKENLIYLTPKARLGRYKEMLSDRRKRMDVTFDMRLQNVKSSLITYIEKLKSRNILDKLKSGLSYVTDAKGKKLITVNQVKKDDNISVRVKDGVIESKVLSYESI